MRFGDRCRRPISALKVTGMARRSSYGRSTKTGSTTRLIYSWYDSSKTQKASSSPDFHLFPQKIRSIWRRLIKQKNYLISSTAINSLTDTRLHIAWDLPVPRSFVSEICIFVFIIVILIIYWWLINHSLLNSIPFTCLFLVHIGIAVANNNNNNSHFGVVLL